MYCAKCGKELNDNCQFCISCGAPTGVAGMSSVKSPADSSVQQGQQYFQPAQSLLQQDTQQAQQQYSQQMPQMQVQQQYSQQMPQMQVQQQYAQQMPQMQVQQQYAQQMPQMQVQQQYSQQMPLQQMMQQPQPSSPPKKKRSKKPFVIAACALAVAAIGVGAFFFVRGKMQQKNSTSITVGGKSYSFKEGYSELANIPIAVQNDNLVQDGRKTVELGDANYLKVNGIDSCTSQEVDPSGYGILGYTSAPHSGIYDFGIIKGTRQLVGNVSSHSNNLNSDYKVITYDDLEGYRKSYGCLQMSFIDGYKIDGLDKNSSASDILKAGYKPTGFQNVYYDIYSVNGVDWEKIDSDYDIIMKANLSNTEMLKGDLHTYLSYDSDFIATFSIIYDLIPISDRQRSFSFAEQKEQYEDKDAKDNTSVYYVNSKDLFADCYNTSYEEALKVHLAIAYQLYLINQGRIDYFVIKEIDASNVCNDHLLNQGLNLGKARFSYPDNVLSIYVISSVEDYERFLKQSGWVE